MTELVDHRDVETDVYQPAEDSRLLLEAVGPGVTGGDRVLDLGTGSGYVGAELAAATGATVVAADVNPHACRAAAEQGLPAVRADLVAPFRDDVFDVVCFNPPYLPLEAEAVREDWMEQALTGGETGRAVIEPFLDTVARVLAPGGRVYLLASSLTGLEAVATRATDAGFAVSEVATEKHPFERLVVLRLDAQ